MNGKPGSTVNVLLGPAASAAWPLSSGALPAATGALFVLVRDGALMESVGESASVMISVPVAAGALLVTPLEGVPSPDREFRGVERADGGNWMAVRTMKLMIEKKIFGIQLLFSMKICFIKLVLATLRG